MLGLINDHGHSPEIRHSDDALMTFFNHLGDHGRELAGASTRMEYDPIQSHRIHPTVLAELNTFPFSATVRYWLKRPLA